MRKLSSLFFLSFFLISCSVNEITNDLKYQNDSNMGVVCFSINEFQNRNAIPLSYLTEKYQYYTVFMYNDSEEYKLQFNQYDDSANAPSFEVKAGTYNAVMLAGCGGNYSSAIGSGNVKEIKVLANKYTNINFTLKPFDYEISSPTETVICGEKYDVSFKIDTRNELLYQPRIYIYETKPTSNFENKTTAQNSDKLSKFEGTVECNTTSYISTKTNDVYVEMACNHASDNFRIGDSTYNKDIDTKIAFYTVDASADFSTNKIFYGLSYTFVTHEEAPNPDDPTGLKIGITWVQ